MSTLYKNHIIDSIDEKNKACFSEMQSKIVTFNDLLQKVKYIIEDSYSEILELTNVAHTVENIVDKIIREENQRYFVINV